MGLLDFLNGTDVSNFKDPFNEKNYRRMSIRHRPMSIFDEPKEFPWTAEIEFKILDTTGTQEIEAKTFPELLEKIKIFIKKIENR